MKKILLLNFCVFFFMFSCSDLSVEDEPDGGTRRGGRSGDRDDRSGQSNRVENVCEGNSYTIYSSGECPEDEGMESGSPIASPKVKHPVDILFVIDTSDSMYFYLNDAFKNRFKSFVSIINENLDWRMLFTNAKYSESGFYSFFSGAMNGEAMKLESRVSVLDRYYLDNKVPHYGDVFRYTITRDPKRINDHGQSESGCSYPPYCQSGSETPLHALKSSFSANKHLVRKEADFVAVVISNTDEDPNNDFPTLETKEIINEFEKVYGSKKRLIVMNLIILPGDKKCLQENDKQQLIFEESGMGEQIADLSKKAGGGNFSICLKDYSVVAKAIVHLAAQ